jgi:FAD/FMN-containing dehydrogenase
MLGDCVILPGDKAYEAGRRLFNQRFDPRPAAIVRCHTEPDVALCLEAARKYRMPFRLRSGGHSIGGYSGCDGIIFDLSGLNSVSIDSAALVATVAAGCQQGKLNRILDEQGVHLPLGDAMDVCIAGFMQGGGWGITSRTFGMNSDHVLEVRVMLADGRVVRASEMVNHDLWWAVRGGTGGNFGVLLTSKYRLHRAPEVNYWCLSWPLRERSAREMALLALIAFQKEILEAGSTNMNAAAFMIYVADKPNDPPEMPGW